MNTKYSPLAIIIHQKDSYYIPLYKHINAEQRNGYICADITKLTYNDIQWIIDNLIKDHIPYVLKQGGKIWYKYTGNKYELL